MSILEHEADRVPDFLHPRLCFPVTELRFQDLPGVIRGCEVVVWRGSQEAIRKVDVEAIDRRVERHGHREPVEVVR